MGEGLDPIKGFFGRNKELPVFIRDLRAQYVHYDQNIQMLFGPITSEVEFAQMTADPGLSRELWKSKEAALQDKLRISYKTYQDIMADIETITKQIASRLDFGAPVEPTRIDLEAFLATNSKKLKDNNFEFRKRIRFGMSKKTIKALLEELDKCNKQLERLTKNSEKIETYHKATKPSYATRLRKLQRASHKTSLQLESRGDIFAAKTVQKRQSLRISFNVSFSTIAPVTSGVPWQVQAAEICIEDEEDMCLTPMVSPRLSLTKNVSFGSLPPYAVHDPASGALPLHQEVVNDLCASIRQLGDQASTIGFSLDSNNKLRGAYPIDATESYVPTTESVSLENLLEHPPLVNGRRSKLSMKERYSLALTLASSVLYLNSTPWLASEWTARDILFHRTSNTLRPIDTERPYLSPMIDECSKDGSGSPNTGTSNNNVLIALAVSLLELYFGTTVEKYRALEIEDDVADQPANRDPLKLSLLAFTWMYNESGNLSAAFRNAVRHCIHGFAEHDASLQDAEFLQAAVENIVLPLQEEFHHFLGKTASGL
ncbi:Intracellular serine protease [Pyrenophora seminiperda CCB06]|uniref:Intracellular serine protease n=1 Tax=Pyrenophora seminiperda CCB06 TaxID=1302712 RepID=A0A3M7MFI6_9PLEO|nr:Intracellular serine protease [Pyrenophora seminiperda CCB06]